MNLSPLRIMITGIDDYSKNFGKINKTISGIGKGMTDIGKKMSMAVSVPLAAMGTYSVITAAKVGDSLRDIQANTGATEAQFNSMKKATESLANIGAGPAKAAEQLKELGRIGLDVNDSIIALPPTLKLASVATLEVADAAQVADGIMDSYGVTVSGLNTAMDAVAYTSVKTGEGVKGLTDILGNTGPVLKTAGYGLNETLAIMRGMDSAGIKVASGMQSLAKGITMLHHPTTKVVQSLSKLGIVKSDIFKKDGTLQAFPDIIDKLAKSGATAADIYTIFGDKVGKNLAPLIMQGGQALRGYDADLQNVGGSMDKIVNNKMKGLGGIFKRVTSSLEIMAVRIGDRLTPAIEKLWSFMEPIINSFVNLPAPVLTTVIALGSLLMVAGPVLVVVGSLIMAFATVTTAIAAAGGVMALLASPLILIGAGIAGAIALFVLLGDTINPLKNFIGGAFIGVFKGLLWVWGLIQPGIMDLWSAFKGLVMILQPVMIAGLAVYGVFQAFMALPIAAGIGALIGVFRVFAWVLKTAVDGWTMLFKIAGDFFKMIDKSMGGPIAKMIETLSGFFKTLIPTVKMPSFVPSQATAAASAITAGPNAAPMAAAGAMAGYAAVNPQAMAGMQPQPTTITIDFKNLPPGVTVTQKGNGAILTGLNGPIMGGI